MFKPRSAPSCGYEQKRGVGRAITPTETIVIDVRRRHRIQDAGSALAVLRVEHDESMQVTSAHCNHNVRLAFAGNRPEIVPACVIESGEPRLQENQDLHSRRRMAAPRSKRTVTIGNHATIGSLPDQLEYSDETPPLIKLPCRPQPNCFSRVNVP